MCVRWLQLKCREKKRESRDVFHFHLYSHLSLREERRQLSIDLRKREKSQPFALRTPPRRRLLFFFLSLSLQQRGERKHAAFISIPFSLAGMFLLPLLELCCRFRRVVKRRRRVRLGRCDCNLLIIRNHIALHSISLSLSENISAPGEGSVPLHVFVQRRRRDTGANLLQRLPKVSRGNRTKSTERQLFQLLHSNFSHRTHRRVFGQGRQITAGVARGASAKTQKVALAFSPRASHLAMSSKSCVFKRCSSLPSKCFRSSRRVFMSGN